MDKEKIKFALFSFAGSLLIVAVSKVINGAPQPFLGVLLWAGFVAYKSPYKFSHIMPLIGLAALVGGGIPYLF